MFRMAGLSLPFFSFFFLGMPAAYDLSTVIGGSGSTVSHNNLIPLGTDTHARTDMHLHARTHANTHTDTYTHTRLYTNIQANRQGCLISKCSLLFSPSVINQFWQKSTRLQFSILQIQCNKVSVNGFNPSLTHKQLVILRSRSYLLMC